MKLIFLYFIVALCFFCKDGEALFFRLKSETQKRESGHSLLSSLSFGDANKRKTSLVGSLPNNGFRAQGAAEDGSREPRDADSLELDVVPAGATSSSDYSSSGPFSTPEKGSHIPEATPKYSETDAIIGEASTWGKGAYKAFNGRVFSFESSCSYTFCRHCVESGGDFNVEIKRNNDSEIEKITVIIDNNDISISGDVILVNGESVHIPYNNKLIHIKKYGEHNVLNSRRGILSLMWDKNNKLSLTIHKQYPTCGLCGNFNNTPGEDIDEHIANSKIPGNCPNAVSKSYELCEDGVQHCEKIIGTYFEKCQKVSSLSNDYKIICIDEYCQNRDAKSTCDTYSELSRLCASDGPGVYESWRDDSAVVCEKPNCPEKHIYKECGPSNPATCSNVAPFQDSECVSGCTCPEGYLLDDIGKKGKCVLKAYCPCESNGNVYQSGEVREGPCGSQCTCQEAKWSCTEALCPGRCKVEGSLITTFDGVKYNHPGNCHFLAIHDKDWSISVELRPCQSGQSGTCLNSVTLLLNSSVSVDKYIFNRDGTVTNDKIRNQSYYYSDKVQIFKVSSSYLQAETYFHVKMQIQIVPVMQLYVSMPPNQFTDTVGLCGSYNNRAEDDFMSSQNILEKTSQAFANSWEMMSCSKGNTASCISIEKEKFAEKNCGILLDSSGPFASCHPIVNPKPYHEECKKYTCACENSKDCLCTILGNYVKACAEKETYIVGWRAELCDHSCPSGLVFKYNVKACNSSCRSLSERDRSCDVEDVPIDGCTCPDGMYHNNEGTCVPKSQCDCYINDEVMQPGKLIHIGNNKCVCRDGILLCQTPIDLTLQNCTGGAEYVDCRDPKAQRRADSTCSTWNIPSFEENLPCKRGCYCPVGMVRNSKGNCVFPEDCPCSFGGREYDQGSVTSVGCNKCTCIKGSWNCTQNECQTTCHIYGEGHIRTFDGKTYSFDGLCQYSFLEDYCGSENGTFRILTESVPCCEDGLTCSRKIIVAFQDQNVVLHDGKVTAVKTTESKECELEENSYSVHTVGLYLILKFLSGITIIWDKNTRISVILDPRWNGKVCGLCGNNNGDLKDDFTTRYSSVAVGELEFGNSWKTSQECSDTVTQSFPCDSNPYCKAWAVRKCEIIRDSTFRDCHNKVDPSAYYDACIEEACACDMEGKYLGFCTAVAMYAEACSAVGVCVTWRKPDLCPVYCDYYNAPGECSWRYEPCGTVTAKTCKDRVIGQKFSALLEGCYAKCPDSAPYLDENTMKCVSLSECSCFYNDIIPAGGVIQDNCGRICYCIAGELECSESALTNSTFTVSTTTATSILSTEAAITLVTSSSSTAASIPAITTSSSGTIGTTLSFLSETFTTGAPGVSEGVTTVSGNKSTSEDSAAPGTTPEGPPGTTGGENAATTGAAGEDTSGASGTTGTSVVSSETSGGAETTGPSAEKSRTTLPTIGMTEIIGSSTEESRATRPSTGRYSPNVSSAVGSQTSRQSTEGSSENGPTEVVTDIYLQSTGISRTTEESGSTGISVIGSGKTGSSTILTVTSARSSVAGSGTTGTVSGASGSTGSSSGSPGATRASIGQPETSRISVAGSSGAPAVSSGASQAAGTSGAGPGTTASSVGVTETARPSVTGSGTTGTVSGASGSTGSSSGSPGATGASIGQPETSRISVAGSSGAPAVSSGASQAAGTSEATTSIEGAGTSGVGFKTEATTFPGENETTRVGIATGTTGIVSRKTLEPGSYNTEATTSIGRSGTTHTDLPGGTTIVLPGFSHSSQSSKPGSSVTTPGSPESGSETGTSGEFSTTVISGSSHTEATTFIGGSGSPGTGSRPGTTGELSGTTIASGNATTEATTSTETRIGPQTGTSEAVSNPAIASGSSSTGTTSGASDSQVTGSRTGTTGVVLGTTVAPGSSSTGATTGVLINEGTRSTSLGTTRVASGTTYESGTSNSESIVPSGGSGTPGSGINTGGSSTQVTGIQTGTTAVGFGSTLLPGSSNTGATTSPSERTSPGSKTGITRVVSGTTVASGSSNTGATTSLGRGETTQGGIKIVITGVTVGTTVAPGSFNTKATTPTEVRAATGAGTAVGATSRSTGISTGPENSTPGTTETGSGTTSSPGGVKTEATTFKGVGTTEAGISSGNSPGSGGVTSSQEGTSREASETTTAPRISATGSTSVSNEITASPKVSSPETTAGATEDQENENKTGCPAPLPPPPVCHGPLGEEKSPGDVWTANCHKCTCTEAKTVDCKPKECPSPPTCKTGERLIKFKANDTCCEIGHCEKRTCLFNNTDYEVGSSFDDPNNPCVTYSCQNTGFTAVVQNCPKQTWCAEEDRVYDSKQCCYTCKSSCKPSPVNVTVRYNGCTIKVEMARCVGECKKTVTYDYDIFQLKNSCLCCQEEDYEFRDIVLDCPDGSTLPYRYRHITACSCLDPCQQSMT